MNIRVESKEETKKLAEFLAKELQAGDIIELEGELGAGKTFFTCAIGEALGADSNQMSSPTFSLIQQYEGKNLPIFHCDFYRLKNIMELEELGIYDWIGQNNIAILEWAGEYGDYLPDVFLRIELSRGEEEEERFFLFIPNGKSWEERVEKWKNQLF